MLKGYIMVTYSVACALGARILPRARWYCVFPSFPGNETRLCERVVPLRCNGISEVMTIIYTFRVLVVEQSVLVTESLNFYTDA